MNRETRQEATKEGKLSPRLLVAAEALNPREGGSHERS